MRKYSVFVAATLILTACGGSNEHIEVTPGKDSGTNKFEGTALSPAEQQKIAQEEAQRKAEYEATLTTLEFDKMIHDFGSVSYGSESTTVFTVTNTGSIPLEISDVNASCGCTTPKKPEGPIAPGASDVIEVTFSPKEGQKGQDINKTVVVKANTKDGLHTLEIKAKVNP